MAPSSINVFSDPGRVQQRLHNLQRPHNDTIPVHFTFHSSCASTASFARR